MIRQSALALAVAMAIAIPAYAQNSGNANGSVTSTITKLASIGPAQLQSTLAQNVTDLWWNPAQSGWGLLLDQMGSTVFGVLFVYGPDNRPTWYTAILTSQGNGVYTGTMYATTGPFFGNGTFNTAQVGTNSVGSMTVELQPDGTALVTYTIGGATVTTAVQRQTLLSANLAGNFIAQSTLTTSGCTNAADNDVVTGTSTVNVSSAANNGLQMQFMNANGRTCTFNGTQAQAGALAGMDGATFTCSNGDTGTVNFTGLSNQNGFFSGQMFGASTTSGCTLSGSFGGLSATGAP